MKDSVSRSLSSADALSSARAVKLASPIAMAAPVLKIATFHSSSLGSLFASLPALVALRDSFPGAHICSYARAPFLPVLDAFSACDEAHARPGGGLSSQAALMAHLHGANYDLALSFSQGSNALLLMWATRAPIRAGFVPSHFDAFLTHRTPKSGPLRPLHALELARCVGASPRGEKARDWLRFSPEILARADALLAEIDGPFLLAAPETGRRSEKKIDLFRPALQTLSAHYPVVVAGLKKESYAFAAADLSGQTDVLTFAAIAQRSRGVVSPALGPLQVARFFDKPSLTLPPGADVLLDARHTFGF